MFSKIIFLSLAVVAMCDSDESQGSVRQHVAQPLTVVYGAPAQKPYRPRPAPVVYRPAPVQGYAPSKPRYGGSDEHDDAKYSFAYQVKAGGGGAYGYGGGDGSDSGERGGARYGGRQSSAEFGHSETRDYGKTDGKYWVDLPDGRRQIVEYEVDGDSGYVAKVSYTDGASY